MLKKISLILLCLCLIFTVAGCNPFKKNEVVADNSEVTDIEDNNTEPEEVLFVNPLTGIKNLQKEDVSKRPVAVMVNNISTAQPVQTGLNSADIIYETEVEGGVTRLMAVFKDFGSTGQLGSIRSARYPYVDLALGHDAIYVHCGQDPVYCAPHLRDIDDMSVDTGSTGAKRIKNGLALEHTLYVFGNELWPALTSKFSGVTSRTTSWQNFAAESETVTLTGGTADRVVIPFPLLKTVFNYDSATGLYTRYSMGKALEDYVTKDNIKVKNIFILMTSISTYPDGKHRKVELNGGNGYYITNGTYQEIKWQKGGEKSSIKVTDANGNPIKVSAGNSWVCIPNTATCRPVFEAAQATTTN